MKAPPQPQLCRRLSPLRCCALCCQGDGYDLCSPLPAGGPDAEGAGRRNPPPDGQNTSAGNRPESIQESPVSQNYCLSGKRRKDHRFALYFNVEFSTRFLLLSPNVHVVPQRVSCHGLCPRLLSSDSMTSHMVTWSRVGLMNNSCSAFVPAEDCNL